MNNYTPDKNEKPLYYSTTVENGEIVHHEGDEAYAVYSSQISTIQSRAKLWHEWLTENHPEAYEWGIVNEEAFTEYADIRQQFMDGEKTA
jgi:hypothetical protein